MPAGAVWNYVERAKDLVLGCTACFKSTSSLSLNGRKFKVSRLNTYRTSRQFNPSENHELMESQIHLLKDHQAAGRRGFFLRGRY